MMRLNKILEEIIQRNYDGSIAEATEEGECIALFLQENTVLLVINCAESKSQV